ncbi:MAG: tetratricopeptide repeat protein, partial [Planctomycetota bacterium]|nr:tetratricopeptide repeat protein [Planctomycetota bacterium]
MRLKARDSNIGSALAAGSFAFLLICVIGSSAALSGELPSERLDRIRRIIGERGEYDLAASQLTAFIEEFGSRPAAAEALLLLGFCQDKLGKSQEAAGAYSRILSEYPNAPANLRADAA